MSGEFQRTSFTTDRTMEFFTKKELTMQIGHDPAVWPLALVKELIDNSLDACEDARVPPVITVTVTPDAVSIQDNGPGLPLPTLKGSLDYMVRVSDKSYYVSPTRGQLGNALKCVWAAPFVVDGTRGRVDVVTGGIEHRVEVTLDRIAQRPNLQLTTTADDSVKTGTLVRMHWAKIASYLGYGRDAGFYIKTELGLTGLVCRYLLFNPHMALSLDQPGKKSGGSATNLTWRKWLPGDRPSPHWYTAEQFRSLITAHLSHDRITGRRRTVAQIVGEFDGLKGSAAQKRVTAAAGLSRALLQEMVCGDSIDAAALAGLLDAMQQVARPVKPAALGIIGKEHISKALLGMYGVSPDSTHYAKEVGEADGAPFVLEVAFGVCQESDCSRQLIAGINWTPSLVWPFRSLWGILADAQVSEGDPIVLVVHLACPRVGFHDRGKSSLDLPDKIQLSLRRLVTSVTKGWTTAKRQADRSQRVSEQNLERLRKATKPDKMSIKAAAYQVMADAYRKAAGALGLANARQIMYAARPLVLALTGGECWKNSSYFTQTLLPDFVDDPRNADITRGWDVVFDARGHFAEPHTRRRTDLGTLGVRGYIADWTDEIDEALDIQLAHRCPTKGPANRYRYALFIEKEGFDPHLARARIAARFDLAIMSTKGMSVTAARSLVEALSAAGVTILVLHDFDKSGLSILHTLRTDTRRYKFQETPRVVDLGLRLETAQEMSLESERVTYDSDIDPRERLRECGASEAECKFLVARGRSKNWVGERIELNAMDSAQFITFLENQLKTAGVTQKVVPDKEALEAAWRRAWRRAIAQEAIDHITVEEVIVPPDIAGAVEERLADSDLAWDDVLWSLVQEHRQSDGQNT